MAVEINGPTSSIVPATTPRPSGDLQAVNATSPASAVNIESVHLTTAATELQALEKAIHEAPDFDLERVSRIRQAIAEGSYFIDGQKLAGNLLRFELQMMAGGPDKE